MSFSVGLMWWLGLSVVFMIGWLACVGLSKINTSMSYWHEQWSVLGREHAVTVSELEKARSQLETLTRYWTGRCEVLNKDLTESNQEIQRLRNSQLYGVDRRRNPAKADVPVLWPAEAGGVVPEGRTGFVGTFTTPESVSSVSPSVGLGSPGEAPGGGGDERASGSAHPIMEEAVRKMRRVSEAYGLGLSRGPQGGDSERGAARGVESTVAAPGVQSTEGSQVDFITGAR